jgi:hypothetical protein
MNQDSLTFKVLDKSSASPSILIIKKDTYPYIMKVWLKNDTSEEAEALRYEDKVYRKNIKPILKRHPKLGLVNYFGSSESTTAEELAEMLDINTDFGRKIFYNSIYIFQRKPKRACDYSDFDVINLSYNYKASDMAKVELQFIVLPCIKYNRLFDVLQTASTERIIKYTKQLIEVIYHIYLYGVIHNDLHSGNVMIDENDNVLLFDWDRCYSVNIGDNPFLDKKRCADDGSDLCFNSQCNIFNDYHYAIDLYKVLYYILRIRSEKGDARNILRDVFEITSSNQSSEDTIHKFLIKKLTKNPFFSKDDCTYLQYPDKKMKKIHKLFGGIDKMYNRIVEKSENVSYEFKFSSVENAFSKSNNVNIMSNIEKQNKYEHDSNMKTKNSVSESLDIEKIIKNSKNDMYNKNRNIYLKSTENKPKRWIYDIMEENNIRKYGKGS